MSYLSESDIRPLRGTLLRFNIPIPKGLRAADELAEHAEQVRQAVLSETEPELTGLTVKNLTDRISEVATWHATAQHRHDAATAALSRAEADRREAWNRNIPTLHALLAPKFAEAAERLTTALGQLVEGLDLAENVAAGRAEIHQAATNAASDLVALRTARGLLGGRLPVSDAPFWRWSQIAEVPSLHAAILLDSAVRRGPNALTGSSEGELRWWANLIREDGVTLRWHTPEEQIELRQRLDSTAVRVGI